MIDSFPFCTVAEFTYLSISKARSPGIGGGRAHMAAVTTVTTNLKLSPPTPPSKPLCIDGRFI